jgi:single-strand DNA-binding protein
MNLNKAFVLGNITKDPEIRSMPNGNQVANFSIATNRAYTLPSGEKKEEVEFHNIVCFGKLADIVSRYLKKGSMVLIEGRIQTRSWDDKATGAKKYKTEIIAELMQMGPKSAGGGSAGSLQQPTGYGRPAFGSKTQEVKQEDIPVIEENYPAPTNEISLDSKDTGEINIADIPF